MDTTMGKLTENDHFVHFQPDEKTQIIFYQHVFTFHIQ